MRDLRSGGGELGLAEPLPETLLPRLASGTQSLSDLLDRFGGSHIERWSDDDWEGFTLQALWRVCCDGVRNLPIVTAQAVPRVRYRDLLREATGEDCDTVVNDLLIRFVGAFLDQGFAAD